MQVQTVGAGWLTPEQEKDPAYRGPVQGKIYPCEPRTSTSVSVKVDGYTWPVWLKPGDQFGGELVE